MLVLSAGTPDFLPMMEECRVRVEALGYRYKRVDLEPGPDFESNGVFYPCTFKPSLVLEELEDAEWGEVVVWVDGDAIVVRDIVPLIGVEHAAVTMRPEDEIGKSGNEATDTVNTGVVVFRKSQTGLALARAWHAATDSFGGDQIGMVHVLRASGCAETEVLPALEWNCWRFELPEARSARILHFKSGFRKAGGPSWWQRELQRLTA